MQPQKSATHVHSNPEPVPGKPLHRVLSLCLLSATLLGGLPAYAQDSVEVPIHQALAEGQGEPMGQIKLEENDHGVLITASVTGLGPGPHGFHLHENGDCGPKTEDGKTTPAGAAGGHYDPEDTGAHRGPYEKDGHLGDLPRLNAGQGGNAEQTNLAPRLALEDFRGRALVIHKGSDNYSDEPRPLGGGGARVACGVVPGG